MHELVTASAKLISGLVIFVSGWLMYQVSKIEPLISQGVDQLFSLGLLVGGIVVLWKAFQHKDKELSKRNEDFIEELIKRINNDD